MIGDGDSPSSDLETAVLGGAKRYTPEEMAAAARLTLEEVRQLWRALGFPDVGEERAFTDADLTALLRVASLVERNMIDLDGVADLARSLGRTTSRLADWQVDALGTRLVGPDWPERLAESDQVKFESAVLGLLPDLEELLTYVWRRQLAATLERSLTDLLPRPHEEALSTVGFADLVSFTRLSRQIDGATLAQVVQTFEAESSDVVHAEGARLVKTLGDEVMFVAGGSTSAARIALALHRVHAGAEHLPQLRIGLATGPVLTRMGDVFGPTVNRASRMTTLARPGTTVIDGATDEALHDSSAYDVELTTRALTPRPVRGLGIVRPYALSGVAADPEPVSSTDSDSKGAEAANGSIAGNTHLR
ncbi:MAG: adenylate/guanylate cyclase domain-containing protein [Candidatus Nanopelagicales bacterium]|nr:adenylate/guanylate cyclase domain-containing protein [Candidatus Nanopelagicales bacterium]MDZ4250757.1 adenylate/guanylate cyclase domain-containing protein [Candidatus Nanopelagicales bacterium]MDZ7577992.1 adenylate/guanylate cyclase domain-containing protein [Candidatus Nanopelagicales bacterium]